MSEEFEAYVAALQKTMQAAIAEAEQLQAEARLARDQAADIRMQTQALLNQYEQAARTAAEADARQWLDALGHLSPPT